MPTTETTNLYPDSLNDLGFLQGFADHELRIVNILNAPYNERRDVLVYPALAKFTHYNVFKGAKPNSHAERNREPFAQAIVSASQSFAEHDEYGATNAIGFWTNQFEYEKDEQDPSLMLTPDDTPLALAARLLIVGRDGLIYVDPEVTRQQYQDLAVDFKTILSGLRAPTPLDRLKALQKLAARQDARSLVGQLNFQTSEAKNRSIDLLTSHSDIHTILEGFLDLINARERPKLLQHLIDMHKRRDIRIPVLTIMEQSMSCVPSPP